MRITGYSDRWSAQPGDTIKFYVSSVLPSYKAQLVQLIHGDENRKGPGVKERLLEAEVNGEYKGRVQEIYPGSFMRVDDISAMDDSGVLTFTVWVKPTAIQLGRQGIFSHMNPAGDSGAFLTMTAEGDLEFWNANGGSAELVVSLPGRMRTTEWQFISLIVDGKAGTVKLSHRLTRFTPLEDMLVTGEGKTVFPTERLDSQLLLAGEKPVDEVGRLGAEACFNGKIACAKLFSRALSDTERETLFTFGKVDDGLLADWDFSHDPAGRDVPNRAGGGFAGTLVNRPLRAVTGPNWSVKEYRFSDAPSEYEAVYFHDDDLEDSGWDVDFTFRIPTDMKSAVYAVKITGEGGARDYLPFIVRPAQAATTAPVALLMPTLSYLAYGNESLAGIEGLSMLTPHQDPKLHEEEYSFLYKYSLRSTYDLHNDGSGISHVSMLRPVLTSFRPYHRCRSFDAPHQFSADLHLVDWLIEKDIEFDVITDHDLHRQGEGLLKPYQAVLSGSHAEYWTTEMRTALDNYLNDGGRLIWLSGNGMYWRMALDNEMQTVGELRRRGGTATWHPAPGEEYLSFTGELAGCWGELGLPNAATTGTKTTGVGFDRGRPYQRQEAAGDPRCAFIFEGVEEDMIGDFPVLLLNHGAAGFEIDRADVAHGTPPHALVVATARGYSDRYGPPMEDTFPLVPYQTGMFNPNVRTDMVFFETPENGAVFNVGAIGFCSALSYNNYRNNVSQIMENVVRRFSRKGPLR